MAQQNPGGQRHGCLPIGHWEAAQEVDKELPSCERWGEQGCQQVGSEVIPGGSEMIPGGSEMIPEDLPPAQHPKKKQTYQAELFGIHKPTPRATRNLSFEVLDPLH